MTAPPSPRLAARLPTAIVCIIAPSTTGLQTNGTAEAAIFYDVAAISAQSQYNLVEVTSYVLMAKDHRLAQLETTVDLADLAEEPFIQMA